MSPNIGSGVEYANHAPFIARGAPDESQVKCRLHLPTGAEVEDVLSLDCATRPCRELTPIAHVFLRGREVDDEDPEGGGEHGVPHLCHPPGLDGPPLRRCSLSWQVPPAKTGVNWSRKHRPPAVSNCQISSCQLSSCQISSGQISSSGTSICQNSDRCWSHCY